jgi:hypothetical protein
MQLQQSKSANPQSTTDIKVVVSPNSTAIQGQNYPRQCKIWTVLLPSLVSSATKQSLKDPKLYIPFLIVHAYK